MISLLAISINHAVQSKVYTIFCELTDLNQYTVALG